MKAIAVLTAFILSLVSIVLGLHFISTLVFHFDLGFLKHSGVGHVSFYILFVLNVLIFQKWVVKESFSSLGLKRFSGWQVTILKGWFAGLLAFIIYTLIMKFAGVIDFYPPKNFVRVLSAVLIGFTGFTIACTEEILFRGFFLQTLLKDLPRWIAIFVTGIIFVFFHKLGNIQDFWLIPYDAMLAGGIFSFHLLLAAAYFKTGSLFLPIGIHSGLVFGKAALRNMKVVEVLNHNSYWFGLGGDARRGFLAWCLFLAGIFLLQFLISNRDQKSLSGLNN